MSGFTSCRSRMLRVCHAVAFLLSSHRILPVYQGMRVWHETSPTCMTCLLCGMSAHTWRNSDACPVLAYTNQVPDMVDPTRPVVLCSILACIMIAVVCRCIAMDECTSWHSNSLYRAMFHSTQGTILTYLWSWLELYCYAWHTRYISFVHTRHVGPYDKECMLFLYDIAAHSLKYHSPVGSGSQSWTIVVMWDCTECLLVHWLLMIRVALLLCAWRVSIH